MKVKKKTQKRPSLTAQLRQAKAEVADLKGFSAAAYATVQYWKNRNAAAEERIASLNRDVDRLIEHGRYLDRVLKQVVAAAEASKG
jgi:hypothetical protein